MDQKEEKKLEKILSNISVITEWWYRFDREMEIAGNKYGTNLKDMLDVARILSAYNVYLANIVADFKVDHNRVFINRKISINKTTNHLAKEEAFNKAQAKAQEEHEDLLENEYGLESLAFKGETVLKHSYRMLDQIQHYINYLRKEYQNLD